MQECNSPRNSQRKLIPRMSGDAGDHAGVPIGWIELRPGALEDHHEEARPPRAYLATSSE